MTGTAGIVGKPTGIVCLPSCGGCESGVATGGMFWGCAQFGGTDRLPILGALPAPTETGAVAFGFGDGTESPGPLGPPGPGTMGGLLPLVASASALYPVKVANTVNKLIGAPDETRLWT